MNDNNMNNDQPEDVDSSPTHDSKLPEIEDINTEKPDLSSKGKGINSLAEKAKKSVSPQVIAENTMANSKAGQTAMRAKNLANNVRRLIQSSSTIIKKMVTLLVNPIFWIVVAVLIILFNIVMGTLAFTSAVGQNLEDDCAPKGSSLALHEGDDLTEEEIKENAFMIMTWLMDNPVEANNGKPFSKKQAAAFVANLREETGTFNPSLIQDYEYPPALDKIVKSERENPTNAGAYQIENMQTKSNAAAMGMFQHRKERLKRMIDIAEESGRVWNNADVQMELLKEELDSDNRGLVAAGFYDDSKPMDVLADIANKYFGSCRVINGPFSCAEKVPESQMREAGQRVVKNALMYEEEYYPVSGGSKPPAKCGGGGDFEGLLDMAIRLSSEERVPCSAGPNDDYVEARQAQIDAGIAIGTKTVCVNSDYADCGKFVATLVTHWIDKDFPAAGTGAIQKHFNESTKWDKVDSSDLQLGDIFLSSGHVAMYLGDFDDKTDAVVEASWDEYQPQLKNNLGYYKRNGSTMVSGDGKVFNIYRYNDTPNGISTS